MSKNKILMLRHKPSDLALALLVEKTTRKSRGKGQESPVTRLLLANDPAYYLTTLPDNIDLKDFVLEVRHEHN